MVKTIGWNCFMLLFSASAIMMCSFISTLFFSCGSTMVKWLLTFSWFPVTGSKSS
uniref:Uncharacterized protein n=1 Tax=Rhizophora mucronata TaxID=61149 RepID=A0A2P2MER1_RHIMU